MAHLSSLALQSRHGLGSVIPGSDNVCCRAERSGEHNYTLQRSTQCMYEISFSTRHFTITASDEIPGRLAGKPSALQAT